MNTLMRASAPTLDEVRAVSASAEGGFLRAAGHCRDAHLQTLLRLYAEDCAAFARALQTLAEPAEGLGDRPSNAGAPAWTSLDAAIRENDDAAILSECERCESRAHHIYMEALRASRSSPARALLERLTFATAGHLSRLRQLRSLFATAD